MGQGDNLGMDVAIRVDASELIGVGHVMRCLVLADQFKAMGGKIVFICANLPGNLAGYIKQRGYMVKIASMDACTYSSSANSYCLEDYKLTTYDNLDTACLAENWFDDATSSLALLSDEFFLSKEKIDLLVVDHYSFDRRWEGKLRPYVKKIMVIDDRANRPHDCDLLLDQNLHYEMESRYDNLIPEKCRLLLGPSYALLRPTFWEARKTLRKRNGIVKTILIFFGGTDPTNETGKALEAIQKLNRPDIAVDVVVGTSNPYKHEISKTCSNMISVNYHCQVENMAELMVKADLAIGAGGSTTWERCSVGLPAITINVADNQFHGSKNENLADSQIYLGKNIQISSDDILLALMKLMNDQELLLKMSDSAFDVMNKYNFHAVIENIIGLPGERRSDDKT